MTKQVKIKEGTFIPADDIVAEWRKDPSYMREYERQKPEFDRLRRQIDRRIARRAWRAAQLARMRGVWQSLVAGFRDFWHWLTRGVDRVAY